MPAKPRSLPASFARPAGPPPPSAHLDRAEEARDRVLKQMVEDGYLTEDQEIAAKKAKLQFVNGGVGSNSAPYFVDMVKDHLLEHLSETDLQTQSFRIYTTLDPNLQNAPAG